MVNIDVRIDGTGSSLELPQEPESSLEASGDAGMAQELQPSPDMAMGLTGSTRLEMISQAVSLGGVDNFSTIEVGESQIDAEGPVDTLGIEAGRGIALTVDGKTLIVTATGGGAGMEIEIVQQLPAEGEPGTLYLVPNQGTGANVYDEYIWIESAQTFEMIGTTEVDLSGYVTDEELEDALDGKADASHTHVKSDVTDLGDATSSSAGLMSAADKGKLDGIETGAQVNAVTGVKGNEESGYRVGNINLTPANIGAAESSHTHSNATTTAAGFMSADNLKTLQQMEIFRAVCTGVQNVSGTCVCTVSAYKGILQVSNGVLLIVQFNAAWQTASAVELNIGASSNLTVCTVGAGGAWPPVSASNPLKWQTGSVMLFLCDWANKKVLLLSRNLPIDAADIQTGTLDAARIPALPYLPAAGGTLTGDLEMEADLTYDSETAYPTFIRSSWSTSSDESTLPVTPCFVLDTSDNALYWCDGSRIVKIGLSRSGGTVGAINIQTLNAAFDRDAAAPSSDVWGGGLQFLDKDGERFALLGIVRRSASSGGWDDFGFYVYNEDAGAEKTHNFAIGINKSGEPRVSLLQKPWLYALFPTSMQTGAGFIPVFTSGWASGGYATLPLPVNYGGSGQADTSSWSSGKVTAQSGVTFAEQKFWKWGKVVTFRLVYQKNAAMSGNTHVGTISDSALRPPTTFIGSLYNAAAAESVYIGPDGMIWHHGSHAANSNITVTGTYVTP